MAFERAQWPAVYRTMGGSHLLQDTTRWHRFTLLPSINITSQGKPYRRLRPREMLDVGSARKATVLLARYEFVRCPLASQARTIVEALAAAIPIGILDSSYHYLSDDLHTGSNALAKPYEVLTSSCTGLRGPRCQ